MFSGAFEVSLVRKALFCLSLFLNNIVLYSVDSLPEWQSKFHITTAEDVDEIEKMRNILNALGINSNDLDKAGLAKKFNEVRDEWVARHPGTMPDYFYDMYAWSEDTIARYVRNGKIF